MPLFFFSLKKKICVRVRESVCVCRISNGFMKWGDVFCFQFMVYFEFRCL